MDDPPNPYQAPREPRETATSDSDGLGTRLFLMFAAVMMLVLVTVTLLTFFGAVLSFIQR